MEKPRNWYSMSHEERKEWERRDEERRDLEYEAERARRDAREADDQARRARERAKSERLAAMEEMDAMASDRDQAAAASARRGELLKRAMVLLDEVIQGTVAASVDAGVRVLREEIRAEVGPARKDA